MEERDELREDLDRVKAILKSHDILMDVDGCGCCGSPSVIMKYKGETIIDEPYASFFMIETD